MQKYWVLGLFLLSLPVALAYKITGNPPASQSLVADSCEELSAVQAALGSWKAGTYPCRKEGKKATISLKPALPQVLLSNGNAQPRYSGPNCYAAALAGAGLSPTQRNSSEDEMGAWFQSPFCKAIKDPHALRTGDIAALETVYEGRQGFGYTHAFVYVTEDLCFQKDGINYDEPYRFTNCRAAGFNVKDACYVKTQKGCETQVVAYRCQPLSKILQNSAEDKRYRACGMEELYRLDQEIEKVVFHCTKVKNNKNCADLGALKAEWEKIQRQYRCEGSFLNRNPWVSIRKAVLANQLSQIEQIELENEAAPGWKGSSGDKH